MSDLVDALPAHYGTARSRRIWTKCVRRYFAGFLNGHRVYVGFTPRIRRPIAFFCTSQGKNLFGEVVYAVARIDNYAALRLADRAFSTSTQVPPTQRKRACANQTKA